MPFPGLRELSGGSASWTFRPAPAVGEMDGATLIGELEMSAACRVRLFKHGAGYRFQYDDTGIYDVSADGREITWCAGPRPGVGAVRADVTGRVLAMALHASGHLCLHGSAVALGDGAVTFVAPKFHGKSTLAFALARAGGRLMTDDVFPVDPGPPARAVPGVHQVRLWDDSADHFDVRRDAAAPPQPGDKHLVHELPDEWLMFQPDSLAAIYLLSPATGESSLVEAARRVSMDPVTSALALVRHAALGPLLGGAEAATIVERAVAISSAVPVYRLETTVGLDRLGDVVAQLLEWHGEVGASPVVAGEGM